MCINRSIRSITAFYYAVTSLKGKSIRSLSRKRGKILHQQILGLKGLHFVKAHRDALRMATYNLGNLGKHFKEGRENKGTNERVVAVISTYNRKELLSTCIKSLLTQIRPPDAIIVVDGPSTDGTREMVNKEFPQVNYIRIREDIGGAGQFYIGIKIAYKKGYDWIWLMDDDVEVVKRDGLKTLLKRAHELRSAGIPIGALIPFQLVRGKLVQVGPLSIFVGGLISRDAISKAGFPRHDFFIYYDDVEYAFRIICAGLAIKYGPPILEHKGWPQRRQFSICFLKKVYSLPILSKKRTYYLARNSIIFAKEYKLMSLLVRTIAGSLIRAVAYSVLLREITTPLYVMRGILEGFLNITGKRL